MQWNKSSINISIFLMIIILIAGSAFSQSNRPPAPKKGAPKAEWQAYWDWQKSLRKQLLGSHDQRKEGTHDGNQIVTLFYNYGSIGKPNTEPSLVWPKASQHGYGFELVFWLPGKSSIPIEFGATLFQMVYPMGVTFRRKDFPGDGSH